MFCRFGLRCFCTERGGGGVLVYVHGRIRAIARVGNPNMYRVPKGRGRFLGPVGKPGEDKLVHTRGELSREAQSVQMSEVLYVFLPGSGRGIGCTTRAESIPMWNRDDRLRVDRDDYRSPGEQGTKGIVSVEKLVEDRQRSRWVSVFRNLTAHSSGVRSHGRQRLGCDSREFQKLNRGVCWMLEQPGRQR